jgi:hypothetical protein
MNNIPILGAHGQIARVATDLFLEGLKSGAGWGFIRPVESIHRSA